MAVTSWVWCWWTAAQCQWEGATSPCPLEPTPMSCRGVSGSCTPSTTLPSFLMTPHGCLTRSAKNQRLCCHCKHLLLYVCVCMHACMRACTFTQLECSLMLALLLKGNIAPEMLLFTSAKVCLQILDIGLPRRLMLRHLSHCSSHVLRMHLQASHSGPRSTSDHPTPLTLHQRLSLIVS